MTETKRNLSLVDEEAGASKRLELALFEMKRVIVGQEELLQRVFVALLTGGHLLLEGVPGLAKTLTVNTVSDVVGGSFSRVQFTPDLVPADLVGTRVYRPGSGSFDTELGPVFSNFLLADEINRAPAKVQSALLEVMQERQVTIGKQSHPVPYPFLVMATQNPIESEGTYPLPEAQLDRFMMKVLVDYPSFEEETAVVYRALEGVEAVEQMLSVEEIVAYQRVASTVYVDRAMIEYAVRLVAAARHPAEQGLPELSPYVAYGPGPRASISLVRAAQAVALMRGRAYALPQDLQAMAQDVLRHRLVLTYEALTEGVTADAILEEVFEAVVAPEIELGRRESA